MYFNNLLPLIFNDWFTFVSVQHIYQTSSLTKEKLFKPPFKTISYGKNYVISSSIQSWNNAQQKLGSSKTLPSAKIKQLISYRWNSKKLLSIVFNHECILILSCLQGNVLWLHAFTLLSRLYFINQYAISLNHDTSCKN